MGTNKRRQIKEHKNQSNRVEKNLEIFPLIMAIFSLENSNSV